MKSVDSPICYATLRNNFDSFVKWDQLIQPKLNSSYLQCRPKIRPPSKSWSSFIAEKCRRKERILPHYAFSLWSAKNVKIGLKWRWGVKGLDI
jgi:hypothetical protein